MKTLKPEPAPLDLKVIPVGGPALLALLQTYDREFMELFKVRAELGTRATDSAHIWSVEAVEDALGVLCKEEPQQHACAGRIPGPQGGVGGPGVISRK